MRDGPQSRPQSAAQYAIVRPFAEHGNWVPVHKFAFDVIMPSVSGSAWKVLSLILRNTLGWDKESDPIAYSQIMKGTGIKSSATVCKALMELRGMVQVDGTGRGRWVRDYDMPDYVLAFGAPDQVTAQSYALNSQVEVVVRVPQRKEPDHGA